MPKKGQISTPMQVVALRMTEEERATLQKVADETGLTLSYVLRQGAKLYAQDLAKWVQEKQSTEDLGARLAQS